MKAINELSEEMDAAYAELTGLLTETGKVDADLYAAQSRLSDKRSEQILNNNAPKALGANEAEREAKLQELTFVERDAVRKLEARRIVLRYRVDVAKLRVEHARNELRLLELQAGTPPLPPLRIAA